MVCFWVATFYRGPPMAFSSHSSYDRELLWMFSSEDDATFRWACDISRKVWIRLLRSYMVDTWILHVPNNMKSPFPKCTWHSGGWPYSVIAFIHQTLHKLVTLSGSKIVKRLRRLKHAPVIIEITIGLVLGPCTDLYFRKICTLTYKAMGTVWRDFSTPPQRRQGNDHHPSDSFSPWTWSRFQTGGA